MQPCFLKQKAERNVTPLCVLVIIWISVILYRVRIELFSVIWRRVVLMLGANISEEKNSQWRHILLGNSSELSPRETQITRIYYAGFQTKTLPCSSIRDCNLHMLLKGLFWRRVGWLLWKPVWRRANYLGSLYCLALSHSREKRQLPSTCPSVRLPVCPSDRPYACINACPTGRI